MTAYLFDHLISQKNVVSCSSGYQQGQSNGYLGRSHRGNEISHPSVGYMPPMVEKKNFRLRRFGRKNASGLYCCRNNSAPILLVTDMTPVLRLLSIFTEVSSSFRLRVPSDVLQSTTCYLAREVEGNIS